MLLRRTLLAGLIPGTAAAQSITGPNGLRLVGGLLSTQNPGSEYAMIQATLASVSFGQVIARVSPPVNGTGAIGGNIPTYTFVDQQRAATWNMLDGFRTGDSSQLNFAVLAMEYAFANQNPDGSWPGATGGAQDTGTAFFMASFGRIYIGFQQSPYWGTYGARLQALRAGYTLAATWLHGRASALLSADYYASNRLFFDALAFSSITTILGLSQGATDAAAFLTRALSIQDPAGWYLEHYGNFGGYDVSYQCVSLYNLLANVVCTNLQAPLLLPSGLAGAVWEVPFIDGSGVVQLGNSVRAGHEPDSGGVTKTINYPEVVLALMYGWCFWKVAGMFAAADRAGAYAVANL